jgi:FkbM family methyltransferase
MVALSVNDISKNRIRRFLQGTLGIRVVRASWSKVQYDANNFVEVRDLSNPVILDVGANIGQSAIWFTLNFPKGVVYALEPFPNIFAQLLRNTRKFKTIRPVQIALGKETRTLNTELPDDPECQTAQVKVFSTSDRQKTCTVHMLRLDDFCKNENIERIHILKTDTEGFDLDVIAGGLSLLETGRIDNILSEVCIDNKDSNHTNLFALKDMLQPYGFEMFSIYDLSHSPRDGRLNFCNALFKPTNKIRRK